MDMTNKEYDQFVKAHAQSSPTWKNVILAFLVGDTICTIGQVLLNACKAAGLEFKREGWILGLGTKMFMIAARQLVAIYLAFCYNLQKGMFAEWRFHATYKDLLIFEWRTILWKSKRSIHIATFITHLWNP